MHVQLRHMAEMKMKMAQLQTCLLKSKNNEISILTALVKIADIKGRQNLLIGEAATGGLTSFTYKESGVGTNPFSIVN